MDNVAKTQDISTVTKGQFEYLSNLLEIGAIAKGRREVKKKLQGEELTYKETLLANCYDCMGGYGDGRVICTSPNCLIYSKMPYHKNACKQ